MLQDHGHTVHNGKFFSTFDRDNDIHPTINCAKHHVGAFWYARCHSTNPNGVYHLDHEKEAMSSIGIDWNSFVSAPKHLKSIEMKMRRIA